MSARMPRPPPRRGGRLHDRQESTSAAALVGPSLGRAAGCGVPTAPHVQAQLGLADPVCGVGGPAPGMIKLQISRAPPPPPGVPQLFAPPVSYPQVIHPSQMHGFPAPMAARPSVPALQFATLRPEAPPAPFPVPPPSSSNAPWGRHPLRSCVTLHRRLRGPACRIPRPPTRDAPDGAIPIPFLSLSLSLSLSRQVPRQSLRHRRRPRQLQRPHRPPRPAQPGLVGPVRGVGGLAPGMMQPQISPLPQHSAPPVSYLQVVRPPQMLASPPPWPPVLPYPLSSLPSPCPPAPPPSSGSSPWARHPSDHAWPSTATAEARHASSLAP